MSLFSHGRDVGPLSESPSPIDEAAKTSGHVLELPFDAGMMPATSPSVFQHALAVP